MEIDASPFAILFDMDGVIVDNNQFHKSAWQQFCTNNGFNFPEDEMNKHVYGRTNKDILNFLFGKELQPEEIDRCGEEKEHIYREIYKPHIKLLKGLIDFLKKAKENNIKLAVATSAPKTNLDFVLGNTNIKQFFDVLVDDSFITHGKPNPEIYLKTADLLDIPAKKCIVIEDSLSGIKAGLNAGMKVIGVTTTHAVEELSTAHHVINDFNELSLEDVFALIRF